MAATSATYISQTEPVFLRKFDYLFSPGLYPFSGKFEPSRFRKERSARFDKEQSPSTRGAFRVRFVSQVWWRFCHVLPSLQASYNARLLLAFALQELRELFRPSH
jgi:hypothetical protein